MSTNKIITYMYFRMEAPLLDWPNFTRMSEIPLCYAHTSFLIQSMLQACKQSTRERYVFFFSFRVVLSCQKASCREIRNEREESIEVSYIYILFIHPKFHDSNNMYHEG